MRSFVLFPMSISPLNQMIHYMKRTWLITLIVSCCTYTVSAQSVEDSLKKVIANSKNYDARFQATIALAKRVRPSDVSQARDYAEQALRMAQAKHNARDIARAHCTLGSAYTYLGDFPQAEANLLTALQIAQDEQAEDVLADTYNNIGVMNAFLGKLDKALSNYFIAARKYAENTPERAGVDLNIGEIYRIRADENDTIASRKAMEYLQKSLAGFEACQHANGVTLAYLAIGKVYLGRGDFEQSLDYERMALERFKQQNNPQGIRAAIGLIGITHEKLNNLDSAIYYLEAVKKQGFKVGSREDVMLASGNLGRIYYTLGKYGQSRENLTRGVSLAESMGRIEPAVGILQSLYRLDSTLGDYQAAFKSLHRYAALRDSMNKNQKNAHIAELEVQYQTEKQAREIAELRRTESQNLLRWVVGMVIVLLAAGGGWYYYKRERDKHQLREAELEERESLAEAKAALAEVKASEEAIEKQRISEQLAHKNQELSTMALHIIERTNTIEKVRESLKEILKGDEASISKSLAHFLRDLGVQEHIHDDMQKFNLYLDDTNKNFFYSLRQQHPNLTQGEERLCTLLRLNLSTQEIATLNSSSPGTVNVALFRLRKKIGYETKEELVSYLQKL